MLIICITLNGCSLFTKSDKTNAIITRRYTKSLPYRGHYKLGAPYTINKHHYVPKDDKDYDEVGIASWYGEGDGFHGRKTANGDVFDRKALTAAHRTLPLPCMVKVTHVANGRSILVMLNDRGPFKDNRILDLSAEAAALLNMKKEGIAKVRVQYLPKETKILLAKLALKPKKYGMYGNKSDISTKYNKKSYRR